MFKKLALLALAATGSIGIANASPIVGGVSIIGGDTFTPTSISFTGPGSVQTSTLPGVGPCMFCVNLPGAAFQLGSGFTPGFLYQINETGVNSSLYVNSITSVAYTPVDGAGADLTVIGTGTLFLTGYDNTPGVFILTSQNAGSNISFSASAAATAVTPEPSSLMLLGTGLLGAAGVARRKLGL